MSQANNAKPSESLQALIARLHAIKIREGDPSLKDLAKMVQDIEQRERINAADLSLSARPSPDGAAAKSRSRLGDILKNQITRWPAYRCLLLALDSPEAEIAEVKELWEKAYTESKGKSVATSRASRHITQATAALEHGDWRTALANYAEAVNYLANHRNDGAFVRAVRGIGDIHIILLQFDQALLVHRQTLGKLESEFGYGDPDVTRYRLDYATLLVAHGDVAEAVRQIGPIIAGHQHVTEPLWETARALGRLCSQADEYPNELFASIHPEAVGSTMARRAFREFGATDALPVVKTKKELASLQAQLMAYQDACDRVFGPAHAASLATRFDRCRVLEAARDVELLGPALTDLAETMRSTPNEARLDVFRLRRGLAEMLDRQSSTAAAEQEYRTNIWIARRADNPKYWLEAWTDLIEFYDRIGRVEEADAELKSFLAEKARQLEVIERIAPERGSASGREAPGS